LFDYSKFLFVIAAACPGWKRKAFCSENTFFAKPETRPQEALFGFWKKAFWIKSLQRTAGKRAQNFLSAKIKKKPENFRKFSGYQRLI
jgi:hypothetical protein